MSPNTPPIDAGPPPGDCEPEFTVPVAVPTPPKVEAEPTVEAEPKQTLFLTPDEKLIHSILQAGMEGYFKARRVGVKASILFDEARPIWELMEEMMKIGRLPSLTEIHLKTGMEISQICSEPIDVEYAAKYIVKRGLTSQLHSRLAPLVTPEAINDDPFGTRDRLVQVYQDTAWGLGSPVSLNSRSAVEQLMAGYNKAASRGDSLLGLSSPWPTADSASLGLQPGELTVVFAKRKIGKTLSQTTVIHDVMTGRERTISELVKAGKGDVLSWEKNSPIMVKSPTDFLDCGTKECLKVTCKSGRSIIAAKTHPFRTPRGWLETEKLQVGHHIASAAIIPAPLAPQEMPSCEIKILAHLIADGTCKTATPGYTKSRRFQALIDDLQASLQQIGGDLSPRSDPRQYGCVKHAAFDGESNPTAELLKTHGIFGKRSVEKTIPPAIFSIPNEQLALFIGRLFSGDGSVEKRKTCRMVSYSTGSKKMAEQLQHLLLRFGVQASIIIKPRTIKSTGEIRDYYELLFRKETIERFKQHIGPHVLGPKKVELEKVQFQGRSRVGWLHSDELKDLIRAEMDARPELLPKIGQALGYSFKFQKGHVFDSKSGRVRRKVFEAFCEIYSSELKWILDENIWWDEIISVEDAGKHHCYDLTVPGTSCYIANDFIVHNSWLVIVWSVHMWRKDLKPGEKILFVTMEMTELQIMRRMACIDLCVPWNDFREGKLDMHQKKRLDDWCADRIASAHDPTKADIIFATSKQCRTARDIGALVAEIQPVCVVVDSFYILGRGDGKSIYEKVLGNVEALKLDVALQYDVPVLASTQLKGTTAKDVLQADSDDAMGAKAIGDYADVTRGLFADEELWTAQERLWRGMEAREFKPKDVHIHFNFDRMDFSEIDEITGQDFGKSRKGDDSPTPKPPRPSAAAAKQMAADLADDDDDSDEALFI